MNIELAEGTADRLRKALAENGFSAVRVRNYTLGTSCRTTSFTGLSLDEPEEGDVCAEVQGIRFVAGEEFLDRYGSRFRIEPDEKGGFAVSAVEP